MGNGKGTGGEMGEVGVWEGSGRGSGRGRGWERALVRGRGRGLEREMGGFLSACLESVYRRENSDFYNPGTPARSLSLILPSGRSPRHLVAADQLYDI
jgi:hypothetical protein